MNLTLSPDVVRAVMAMDALTEPPDRPAAVNGYGGNNSYRDFIHSQPCLGCKMQGRPQSTGTQHHHIENRGLALRCADEWSLPLCMTCHDRLHRGKKAFLQATGLPDFRIPAIIYLANYCYNRRGPEDDLLRAVYYFKELHQCILDDHRRTHS